MASKYTPAQRRVVKVLERLAKIAKGSEYDAQSLCDPLNSVLEELASDDFFGTERQNDPRGDGRNGHWTMWKVEGVDK